MEWKACFILSKDSLQSSKKVINSSAIDTLGKRIESNEKRKKKNKELWGFNNALEHGQANNNHSLVSHGKIENYCRIRN